MYFHKHQYFANYEFLQNARLNKPLRLGPATIRLAVDELQDDIYRISLTGTPWKKKHLLAPLTPPPRRRTPGQTTLTIDAGFGLTLRDSSGHILLSSPSRRTLGLCGASYMFMFHRQPNHEFYGMGEKWLEFEHSSRRTKFWNTDVWADFQHDAVKGANVDPLYVSIPYMILKQGNTFVGLLIDSPDTPFLCTDDNLYAPPNANEKRQPCFSIGAEGEPPSLFLLTGPSLAELTRKLQKLVGRTPLPPAWALGYHQCKWGYRNDKDLEALDRNFRKYKIPCDGLWLDIDYMDGYRVFTFNKKHFPRLRKTLAQLKANDRHVVPILDPGVKMEKGYSVYDNGHKKRVFCLNPQGREYVGTVWPGDTVFPDFASPKTRAWWTDYVKKFSENGIHGAWIDMNDPSTGIVDNLQMLFLDGREEHRVFHNQYALGMAMATHNGFLAAHPKERPFVLSRSGFTGSARFTAIWTGDNCPNYEHLRKSIPCTLNLALSGIPFNGPDIGGFGGNTTPELLTAWLKTCFLFPFCRNHAMDIGNYREPWAFGRTVMKVLRHYIVSRYKLRPYLYNLFMEQEKNGDAILRPLFYDFVDTPERPLSKIADQFMVGPAILQAPLLGKDQTSRSVVLPGTQAWLSVMDNRWIPGNRTITVRPTSMQTPLYLREGSILPVSTQPDHTTRYDGRAVEFHILLRRNSRLSAETSYSFDDGISFEYQKGQRSTLQLHAEAKGNTLHVTTRWLAEGFGHCPVQVVVYDTFTRVLLNGREVQTRRCQNWPFSSASH